MDDPTDLVPMTEPTEGEVREDDTALVKRLMGEISADRAHFQKAFVRMRQDMQLATHGRLTGWPDGSYVANIVGRHVKQKTAALYAKNPKVVARRRETLDFALWDENPESLMLAQQTIQAGQQAMMGIPNVDPATGMAMPPPPVPPEAVEEATALMADVQQGLARRQMMNKWGKTLQVLFNHAMQEQRPLDFKMGMKRLVRRASTTGVGYVEIGFVREYGPTPVTSNMADDLRNRLAHLRVLADDAAEGEIEELSAEMRELELSLAALQQEELVVVKEGLVFDYPQSTRVIPDRNGTSLVGFVGCRHLTIEYLYTVDEVREQFPDADLDRGFTAYSSNWNTADFAGDTDVTPDPQPITDSNGDTKAQGAKGMVRVYKHYDKPSGLCYYMAEGYKGFLRPPAPPDVFVEDFWPVYALTFNEVENEKELFPPSDARLMLHQQLEINRSRQGQSEHRKAGRPRFAIAKGALEEQDKERLATAEPFDVIDLNVTQDTKIGDVLQPIPIPGVDPNLYETSPYFEDMQLVVGSQQAVLGGIAKATATESAIAANSMAASDGSSVDDLDNFLTMVARASGQVLLREMSPERVKEVAGPGAVWPDVTLDQIADELYLEIEAGSTGKPNQATEINNWQQMLPMILQMPGISPTWLARETLRRLDDRMDLTDALASGLPSIAAQNQAMPNMIAPAGPQADPAAQGAAGQAGASNMPAGPSMTPGGSGPAFGSNQVQ